MKLSSSVLYYFSACIVVVAPFVVMACRRVVKPIALQFETNRALSDAAGRLLAICESDNSKRLHAQWIIGSVSKNDVALQCQHRGMKAPITIFDGKFIQQENQVVLKGTFHISLGTQCSLIAALAFLIFFVAVFAKVLIFDRDLQALAGIAVTLAIIFFLLFVVRLKTKDSAADMEWIASSITAALQK